MLRQTHEESEEERTALPTPNELLEDDDSMNLSDDSPQIFNPPPRIAARFYRPTNNRRKSSAASSRRNSISSTHSHQSNRSYHGGCQSNHVAQHLRRASILESRKARLADRAAHAEQVRLRAALAKAAPRSSNSEEKALAAQQAREKRLAEIAAACAEEVRRAKKVAEDMKERKAAEERRYRLEMEEKLADAEKRRLEYKKNSKRPRTTSLPAPDKKMPSSEDDDAAPAISSEEATKRIQKAWRVRQRRRAVDAFLEMGLSIDRVHDASFEEVSSLLGEEKLLTATARVLHVFGLKSSEASSLTDGAAVRTFLSAYLILGHPAEVLSKDGHQEQDLITKAKDLIISFESALSKLSSSDSHIPTPTQVETVHLAHGAFVTAFSDWKARDSSALVETMVASFVNLDAIWQGVKDDTSGAVAEDYRQGIRDNQVMLLSKIRKLAGPDRANFLIKKAVTESRRARARKRPRGDVRPRAALETPSPPELAEPEAGSPSQKAASRLDSLREKDEQQHQDQGTRSTSRPSSRSSPSRPPLDASSGALDAQALSKLFSALPPNRVLTHELAIDREFRINRSPRSDIGDAFNRAVCDSMLKGFQDGQGDVWTAAMAENIRVKLLRLLKPGYPMHTLVSETLDPDYIQQQCQQGVFSYEKFFSFMATILPKLCAPMRDEQVKTLAEELEQGGSMTEMIERLFKLLQGIDLLSLDHQNFLLRCAAPTLIREAPGYEQRMFAQDLESGTITLQKTRRWWSNASVNVLTESDPSALATSSSSSTAQRDPSRRPTPQKIYSRGLVDLAIATTPLLESDVPETLQLDSIRLASMRASTLRTILIGAILLTAKNLLKRDVRAAWKPEAARLWELLKDSDAAYADDATPGRVLATIESAHTLPPATRAQLASTIARLLAQAREGRLVDPVAKVLFARLKSHVFGRISASSSGEKVRAASAASEGLAATGLPEFVAHVGEMVDMLGRIGDVDQRAHEEWYRKIQMEVEGMGSEEEGK